MPFNPLSPKELNYILFQKLKLPSKGLAKTKKGEISTQESELLKIIDTHPIVPKILDYRKLVKVASTYTDSLLVSFDPKDGRVHPVYNQTGTSTGRLSSENPNVQNIPLKGELADLVREAFIAEKGFLFLGADYSQLELRLAAHLSEDENLLAAFKNNLDIHSQTAKLVFGEENLETRRMAKAINFGIIYGMQAKGLAERLRIPISQAQKIIERYFHFYPGLKKMREDLIEKAKIYGYAETLSGRKLSLPEIYSNSYREKSEAERIAVNMPIQGLGADIIKKAMIAIDRALYEEFIKEANLILSVHDELVLEVKEEKIDAISKIVKEKMEKAILLSLPLEVKIKEGRNLLEIKK
jgi:DNA polymerase-1